MRGTVLVVVWLILASVLNVATPPPAKGPSDTISYPVVSAHRGGMTIYPENTLTAFKTVRDNHAGQPIEFDVRGLKDGTLVINHDATIDRTSTATGKLSDLTRSQWSKVRINNPQGGTVPATTVDEVLGEFGGTDMLMVPELKDAAVIDKFIETLWPYRDQVIVQSFNRTIVSRLVRTGFKTLQLANSPTSLVPGVYAVGYSHSNITQKAVDDAHRAGVTVWAWTVNNQNRIDELMGMEVDAVMTNNPNLTMGVRTG